VGTPQRLIDLIENGTYNNNNTPSRNKTPFFPPANPFSDALSLANLKRIVVDASHIDQKKRGIVDMRETMMPLAKLLCMQVLKERYEDETARHIDLIFY
jgi:protein CMS1